MYSFGIHHIQEYPNRLNESKSKRLLIENRFIAHSEKMKDVLQLIEKVSKFPSTVLLVGESGVGKEMVASAIYELGHRSDKPFIKVNCGAIPENLIESELFGYTKGAFTGADPNGKVGYFLQANHGVLFLDEVAELPLNLQVKLLRVIQEREVVPLGATEPIKIDIQIIAATNKNLEVMVEENLFRKDLYFRLNVVPIYIPPLRQRKEDIPYLAKHFLTKYNQRYKRNVTFSEDAINKLMEYTWYGNVRELENLIERTIVTSDDNHVNCSFFEKINYFRQSSCKPSIMVSEVMNLQEAIDTVEEQLIILAMEKYKSIKLAAEALGVSPPTMSRKYQKVKEKLESERNDSKKNGNKDLLEKELDNQLRSVSIVIAALINVDKIKLLSEHPSKDNPIYENMRNLLTVIRKQEGKIEWTYIWKVNEDKIINIVADEKLDIKPGEEYQGPPEMVEAVFEGAKGKVVVTPRYTDKYGQWKSSIAPIKDESGNVVAVLGVDFSAKYIEVKLKELDS